jgi:hypothetical protein
MNGGGSDRLSSSSPFGDMLFLHLDVHDRDWSLHAYRHICTRCVCAYMYYFINDVDSATHVTSSIDNQYNRWHCYLIQCVSFVKHSFSYAIMCKLKGKWKEQVNRIFSLRFFFLSLSLSGTLIWTKKKEKGTWIMNNRSLILLKFIVM